MRHIRTVLSLAIAGVSITACSGRDDSSLPAAQAASSNQPAADGNAPASAGAPSGRPAPTVTLAATDIAQVRRGSIEEDIAITGDLRPIETVEVRARIEGDLVAVHAREGQRVKAGQMLARFESSEQTSALTSARADRVAADSELATSQWNLEQTTELYRAGAVSERDFKTAQQSVITARARLAAANARVRAASSLATDTRVVAPTSGVIARRNVENGEHVSRGASMFQLVRSDVLELAAAVPARQANAVKIEQTVHFVADGRSFDGKVARVSPTVDPATRSVTVYVQVANRSGALKGGTFATGRIVSRVVENAIVVPAAALRQSPEDGRPFVYRVAGQVLDVATVQLGIVNERSGVAEVVQGLSAGDRVIVGNVGTLGRGMRVVVAGEENVPR